MSSLIVEVCEIEEIKPHPTPGTTGLEIAIVKGWECAVTTGKFKKGDKVVYIPIDSVLPIELSDKMGVTKYLSKGKVKAARLRSYPSYGILMTPEDPKWHVGKDVAKHYGITKWEPPPEPLSIRGGDKEKDHPLFVKYTDIENIKNFKDWFFNGEKVVITEKIHGTNFRCGIIDGILMAGSHNIRKKNPNPCFREKINNFIDKIKFAFKIKHWPKTYDNKKPCLYWEPLKNPNLINLLKALEKDFNSNQVMCFGEIYGGSIQDLKYGETEAKCRLFDILVKGHYLDYEVFLEYCKKYSVDTVPELYVGPFSFDIVNEHTTGNTTINNIKQIREGCVIKPIHERRGFKGERIILKSINFDYLERKNATENH